MIQLNLQKLDQGQSCDLHVAAPGNVSAISSAPNEDREVERRGCSRGHWWTGVLQCGVAPRTTPSCPDFGVRNNRKAAPSGGELLVDLLEVSKLVEVLKPRKLYSHCLSRRRPRWAAGWRQHIPLDRT